MKPSSVVAAAVAAISTLGLFSAVAQDCTPTTIAQVLSTPVDLYEIDGRFMREANPLEVAPGGRALDCGFADHVVVSTEPGWRFVRRSAVSLASSAPSAATMDRCMCSQDFAQENQLAAPAGVPAPMCPTSTCEARAQARTGAPTDTSGG